MEEKRYQSSDTASFRSKIEFTNRQNEFLDRIGMDLLMDYDEEIAADYEGLYRYIGDYAVTHRLLNTSIALPVVRGLLLSESENFGKIREDALENYKHALAVCHMLIDLHLPLFKEELDITLASALCHVLVESIAFPDNGQELVTRFYLDERVRDVVLLVTHDGMTSDAEKKYFYGQIQENKYALLVKLADRGNIIQKLYDISLWDARECIRETRQYFFPMCLYAKMNYEELNGVVSLMMEKLRSMMDMTDILASRFQERELDLNKEILRLREENARFRVLIARLKAEKKYEY